MNVARPIRVDRRTALIGGGGALALMALPVGRKLVAAAPTIQSGGGVAGGGSIAVGTGTAQFSLFASRFAVADQKDPLIFGRVQWMDDTGFGFESAEITSYGPIDGDDKNARALEGKVTLSTDAVQVFRLRIVDSSAPGGDGTGDEVELTVGPADNHIYEVKGPLTSGDIQLLTFEFPD